jgi:acyl-CoA thioesterase-1
MFRVLLLFVVFAPAVAVAEPVLLVVGDSLSAGYGIARADAWTTLLQDRLEEEGFPHRVVNASISGDTTRGGLARLPAAIREHAPSIVILELGGNDGLRGIPVGEIRRNLARMIRLSHDAGARVVLAGVHIPPNYGPRYTEQFHQVYHDLAAEYGTALVPFILDGVALEDGLMQADGLHPNKAGQPVMLENVWPALLPVLAAEAGLPSSGGGAIPTQGKE